MKMKETGGAAFPLSHQIPSEHCWDGMTLRDYFAAKALSTIQVEFTNTTLTKLAAEIAQASYLVADAMITERSK